MADKKNKLPKNFEDLLAEGKIQELKNVYSVCSLNAIDQSYTAQTAFAFENCPHELGQWLVEQGANIEGVDGAPKTPLFKRAASESGNIKSLIDLGADVNKFCSAYGTPVHNAARALLAENVQLLIENGANIHDVNIYNWNALEVALKEGMYDSVVQVLEVAKICLAAGLKITPKMKDTVSRLGEYFEFKKDWLAEDKQKESTKAMNELYNLFEVKPVLPLPIPWQD